MEVLESLMDSYHGLELRACKSSKLVHKIQVTLFNHNRQVAIGYGNTVYEAFHNLLDQIITKGFASILNRIPE